MQKAKSYRNLIWGCCMTGIAMFFAFFFLYHTYIQDIIYEERLNQMEEITRQMFQNLEDVIDSHWDRVTEECNYLRDANIQTTDELCRHMKKKYELSAYADQDVYKRQQYHCPEGYFHPGTCQNVHKKWSHNRSSQSGNNCHSY